MWKPIETAPDGDDPVLAWDGKYCAVVSRLTVSGWGVMAGWSWAWEGDSYTGGIVYFAQTHWMPLPDPPSAGQRFDSSRTNQSEVGGSDE